ncbi:acyl-CoA-binding protein [Deinococcus radiophilus]|uniref:Acyl-CoA-binding protein n=1 Tax=Deinococcus radiophilus TaxID=32062 RepID=A0A3S0L266_9DEIO|nr:acyl-CoA-binding protein [Deinococcus radiophilus]RTR25233.1 acyl-CoA-binding protein [Deinococcus radiophilus]UFA50239.1 acyl-CoA-binding protein [Deinococcus radiophilus]
MSTEFEQAQQDVNSLSRKPGNSTLLQLYALYKQGTQGDVTGERPGGFDFASAAKFDAWQAEQGKTPEQAQQEYVSLVRELLVKDQS